MPTSNDVTTARRPGLDLAPSTRHRLVPLVLALLSLPGSTIAWELPAGGLWIGLPLGIAAIVIARRDRRDHGRTGVTTAALILAALAIGQMAVYSIVLIVS